MTILWMINHSVSQATYWPAPPDSNRRAQAGEPLETRGRPQALRPLGSAVVNLSAVWELSDSSSNATHAKGYYVIQTI